MYVVVISYKYLGVISNKYVAVISNNYVAVICDKYVAVLLPNVWWLYPTKEDLQNKLRYINYTTLHYTTLP